MVRVSITSTLVDVFISHLSRNMNMFASVRVAEQTWVFHRLVALVEDLEVILSLASLMKIDERKKSTLPLSTFVKVLFSSLNSRTSRIPCTTTVNHCFFFVYKITSEPLVSLNCIVRRRTNHNTPLTLLAARFCHHHGVHVQHPLPQVRRPQPRDRRRRSNPNQGQPTRRTSGTASSFASRILVLFRTCKLAPMRRI